MQFISFGRLHKSLLKISICEIENLNLLVLSSILDPQDNKLLNREKKKWSRRKGGFKGDMKVAETGEATLLPGSLTHL